MDAQDRALLAPTGRLRAAMNLGNKALVRRAGDGLEGIAPALAARLAAALGVPVDLRRYDSARAVVETAQTGVWDIAFLGIDPGRARHVAYSLPYLHIEGTYAVRTAGGIADVAQADAPGRCILVAHGAAYDLYLTGALRHAALVRVATPAESMHRFREGEGDLVAGVRQSLEAHFRGEAAFRVLDGRFTVMRQALAVPLANVQCLPALDRFLAEARAAGFIADALAPAGAGAAL